MKNSRFLSLFAVAALAAGSTYALTSQDKGKEAKPASAPMDDAFMAKMMEYGISDWDVGISLIMGGLTYLCAPWSVRSILTAVRYRSGSWILRIGMALSVAWVVVDGVYVLYHTAMGNQMFRIENFYASSALYFLGGAIWLYRGSLRELLANVRGVFRRVV